VLLSLRRKTQKRKESNMNPTLPSLRFQAHLAFPQCLPSIQKCQKSLQSLPTPTHRHKDNAAKIKNRLTNDKNGQLPTSGIFYCRVSANLKGCSSLQSSSWFDSDVLQNRQQKHTAIRVCLESTPARVECCTKDGRL